MKRLIILLGASIMLLSGVGFASNVTIKKEAHETVCVEADYSEVIVVDNYNYITDFGVEYSEMSTKTEDSYNQIVKKEKSGVNLYISEAEYNRVNDVGKSLHNFTDLYLDDSKNKYVDSKTNLGHLDRKRKKWVR